MTVEPLFGTQDRVTGGHIAGTRDLHGGVGKGVSRSHLGGRGEQGLVLGEERQKTRLSEAR